MAQFRFCLVDEVWVPCLVGGQGRPVSLRGALTGAHEIDGLAVGNPLETVAILRQVLLPVYIRVCGLPRTEAEWAARWDTAQSGLDPKGRISTYLDDHADAFDLFDEGRPFAQVAGLRTAKNETKPVSLLIASSATGNNVPLFSSRTESDPPALDPAAAARALLAAQCWDTAAIKSGAVGDSKVKAGKTTGNPTSPLGALGVTVLLGRNLAETLLLNTPIKPQGLPAEDQPQWYGEPATAEWWPRPAKGLLDLLTWQSRRIRLIPEADADGQVRVRQVVLAAGDRLTTIPDYEPHTAWRRVDKPGDGAPPIRPVRHVPGRAAWRGLEALLATQPITAEAVSSSDLLRQINGLRRRHIPRDFPLQVLTVGVQYGNQSAVVEDVMTDMIPLPVAALDPSGTTRQRLLRIVTQAEDLRKAGNRLSDDLRRAQGAEGLAWDKGQRLGDMLIHQFTPVVRRVLAGLQRNPDDDDAAEDAWKTTARRLAIDAAETALASAPPETFLGRKRKETVYSASTARAWFHGQVRRILGVEVHDSLVLAGGARNGR